MFLIHLYDTQHNTVSPPQLWFKPLHQACMPWAEAGTHRTASPVETEHQPHVSSLSCLTLQPQGLQPTRPLCPWNFPDKNTGVGLHFLLQGIFPTQGSNLRLMHWQVDSWPLSHLGSSWATQVASSILVATLKKEKGTDTDDTNSNVSRQYIQNIISTCNQYRKTLFYATSLKSGVYFCCTSQFRSEILDLYLDFMKLTFEEVDSYTHAVPVMLNSFPIMKMRSIF